MKKNGFAISSIIYSLLIAFSITVFGILSVLGTRKLTLDKLKNQVIDTLEENLVSEEPSDSGEEEQITGYKDNSGANIPDLLDNMVAIKYVDDNWVVADTQEKWYDYDNQE